MCEDRDLADHLTQHRCLPSRSALRDLPHKPAPEPPQGPQACVLSPAPSLRFLENFQRLPAFPLSCHRPRGLCISSRGPQWKNSALPVIFLKVTLLRGTSEGWVLGLGRVAGEGGWWAQHPRFLMADGRAMAPLIEATQVTVLPLGGISQVRPQADVSPLSVRVFGGVCLCGHPMCPQRGRFPRAVLSLLGVML